MRGTARAFLSAPALFFWVLLVWTGSPAAAQQTDFLADREYRICLSLAAREPEEAFEHSLRWHDAGGGDAALHCSAIALINLGHYAEAATRLEKLARGMPDDTPPNVVAEIFAHAGIAWQQADNLDRALEIQNSALELSPNNPDILTDRAITFFSKNEYWEAIDDLNQALFLAPGSAGIHALRASAYRYVDTLDLAMEDANRALQLEPDNPEALLERGIIHRLQGNAAAARQDWLTLIRLHDGRPAAEDAKRNLEMLDVQVDDVAGPE